MKRSEIGNFPAETCWCLRKREGASGAGWGSSQDPFPDVPSPLALPHGQHSPWDQLSTTEVGDGHPRTRQRKKGILQSELVAVPKGLSIAFLAELLTFLPRCEFSSLSPDRLAAR